MRQSGQSHAVWSKIAKIGLVVCGRSFRAVAVRIIIYGGIYILVAHFMDKPAFPPLWSVVAGLGGDARQEFLHHLAGTFGSWAKVFGIGAVLGISVGVFLVCVPCVYRWASVDIDFFRSLPATVLVTFIMAAFGDSDTTRTFPAMYITFFTIVFYVSQQAQQVSMFKSARPRHLRMLGGSWWFIVRHCVVFEVLPQLLIATRQAVSLSFLVLVSVELMIGPKDNWGLGGLLYLWYYQTDYQKMLLGIVLIGVVGYLLNVIMMGIEWYVQFWKRGPLMECLMKWKGVPDGHH